MRLINLGLVVVAMLLLFYGVVFAQTIDLWDSFPDSQGQNHLFAQALPWENEGEYSYRMLDDVGAYRFATTAETDLQVPYIYRGTDPWIEIYPAAAESSGKGTGLEYENAIFTYKVYDDPGTYNISGVFQKGGTGDSYVFVKHNTEFLWSHTFLASDAVGTQASFDLAGEDFVIDDKL